jgi:predicted NAD/FAD-binding protein
VTSGSGRAGGTAVRPRAAVVGSGVAGLTAAYILQRRYDVTLFEADHRLGGHAHTHDVRTPSGSVTRIDTGFIVHNRRTYPLLRRLFRELAVDTQDTEMSMSVRCRGCGLEYAGARGIRGLTADRRTLTRPAYLRMLAEVTRFHRQARAALAEARAVSAPDGETLGDFLVAGRYSRYFTDHFVMPLVSAVWSTPPRSSALQPTRNLFEFLDRHGMLSVGGSPSWQTVVGGSRTYVDRVAERLSSVRVSAPVRAVARDGDQVEIRDDGDRAHAFDRAVIATHPDQALGMLADPTLAQKEILGAFEYARNDAVLHTDASILPSSAGARASWNYLKSSCSSSESRPLVSYHLNRLMRLNQPMDYLVTLNAGGGIAEESVIERMRYEHPVYTPESLAARHRLPEISDGVLAFAGAYHGWGFHEDGCVSGARAAAALGVDW